MGSVSGGKIEEIEVDKTYLHLPGRIACHPLGVRTDRLLQVAV
jgi:hypothetical protein